MTMLQEWAAALCAAGLACAFLRMLCPKGSLRRTFGILTALFFFCCLIAPLSSLGTLVGEWFTPPTSVQTPTVLAQETEEQVVNVLEEALLADAQERLAAFAVQVKKVRIIRDTDRADSIYIERVSVTFDKADYPLDKGVANTLEQAWGVIVEVQYGG